MSILKLTIFLVATLANVYFWRQRGTQDRLNEELKSQQHNEDAKKTSTNPMEVNCPGEDTSGDVFDVYEDVDMKMPTIGWVDSQEFDRYRSKYLGFFRLGDPVVLTVNFDGLPCRRYLNSFAVRGDRMVTDKTSASLQCVAAVRLRTPGMNGTSHHLMRYDISSKFDEADDAYAKENAKKTPSKDLIVKSDDVANPNQKMVMRVPTGYFTKVSRKRNREKVNRKMTPFFANFHEMDKFVDDKLTGRGFKPGDDIILMVLNVGEVDLFMNFACSCRFHGISLEKVVVFSANDEIVNIIENTGALAMHHKGFADVLPAASGDYLDFIFVDMMWYKSFSLWMVIKRGYNVLFQDVDLVWFKDPFPYLHNIVSSTEYPNKVDAIFTDDGQRGLRYSPFYANSGFYYVTYSEQTTYFAWSIMTGFPMIQRTGSHQNVFTMRLQETMDLGKLQAKLLTLHDFPNGFNYHHNKTYMVDFLVEKKYQPYNFHMCWTQRKADKLNYLKKTLMWYLNDKIANLETLGNPKKGVSSANRRASDEIAEFHRNPSNTAQGIRNWNVLSDRICSRSSNSP